MLSVRHSINEYPLEMSHLSRSEVAQAESYLGWCLGPRPHSITLRSQAHCEHLQDNASNYAESSISLMLHHGGYRQQVLLPPHCTGAVAHPSSSRIPISFSQLL